MRKSMRRNERETFIQISPEKKNLRFDQIDIVNNSPLNRVALVGFYDK